MTHLLPSTAPCFPGNLLRAETEGVRAVLSLQVPKLEGGLHTLLPSISISISPPNWDDSPTGPAQRRGSQGGGVGRGPRLAGQTCGRQGGQQCD